MRMIASIIFLILCCAACQTAEGDKVWPDLVIQLEDQEISVPMDAVTPVEFTVSGTDGAEVMTQVTFQDTSWSGEGYVDAETGEGVLYISAPDKVGTSTALVAVKDEANKRETSIYISVSSAIAGVGQISLAFTREAYEMDAGDTLSIAFRVSALGNAQFVEPQAKDVATELTVVSVDSDPVGATGTVSVSAPETHQGGEVTVTMKVKDSFNRTAQASAVVTVIAKPASVVPGGPDVPGSSVVPADKSYNCYMVQPGGYARFTKKMAEIVRLELAWQDAPDLIQNMSISPSDGYVTVLVNDTAGNALVLGKDANGKTLWSWHIWAVDFDPDLTAVTVDGVTFMDRNLGAVSAVPGDIGAIGQAYQWGRKDPMPRVSDPAKANYVVYDIDGNLLDVGNSGDGWYKIQQGGTLAESIANPDTFFKALSDRSWIKDADYQDWWGGVSFTKSEYDPCPQGWKVPVISSTGVNPYQFMKTEAAAFDSKNIGVLYTGTSGETLWFPCNGQRSRSKGWIHDVDGDGNYWLGTDKADKIESNKYKTAEYLSFKSGSIGLTAAGGRTIYQVLGCGVRCVKE